jgi:hypothetical protein
MGYDCLEASVNPFNGEIEMNFDRERRTPLDPKANARRLQTFEGERVKSRCSVRHEPLIPADRIVCQLFLDIVMAHRAVDLTGSEATETREFERESWDRLADYLMLEANVMPRSLTQL